MKTFADVLRVKFDIKFPEDTVVIDATNLYRTLTDDFPKVDDILASQILCMPIFQNMLIYTTPWVSDKNLFMTEGWFCSSEGDTTQGYMMETVSIDYIEIANDPSYRPESLLVGENIWRSRFFKGEILECLDWKHSQAQHPHIRDMLKLLEPKRLPELVNGALDSVFPLLVMAHLHQKHEVELVEPSRQYRRQMKRKTGKTPSPYFMLKVGKAPKEYASTGNGTGGSGHKNKMHVVRGHFRTNTDHPLPQFNRTMWIPAHMRGDESRGRVNKGYTIETD